MKSFLYLPYFQVNEIVLCDLAKALFLSKRGLQHLSKLEDHKIIGMLLYIGVTNYTQTDLEGKTRRSKLRDISSMIIDYVKEKCDCLEVF